MTTARFSKTYHLSRAKNEFVTLRLRRGEITATWCPSISALDHREKQFGEIEQQFKTALIAEGIACKRKYARHRCGQEMGECSLWRAA